jgi:hypothetical protein
MLDPIPNSLSLFITFFHNPTGYSHSSSTQSSRLLSNPTIASWQRSRSRCSHQIRCLGPLGRNHHQTFSLAQSHRCVVGKHQQSCNQLSALLLRSVKFPCLLCFPSLLSDAQDPMRILNFTPCWRRRNCWSWLLRA